MMGWLNGALNLASLEAGAADLDPAGRAFYHRTDRLKVGKETTLGLHIGVGNVMPRHRPFAANITFKCHKKFSAKISQNYCQQV